MTRRELLLEIGVVLCLAWLPHLVSAHFFDPGAVGSFFGDMASRAAAGVQVVAPLLYIIFRSGEPWSKFGIVKPKPIDLICGTILLGLLYVLDPVFWLFIDAFGTWDAPPSRLVGPSSLADYVLLVPAIFVAAFAEELAMRAYLIPRLRDLGFRWVSTLLISSAFFASYHLYQGAAATVYLFLWGLVYGVAFLLTPRVWLVTVGHTLQNVFIYLGAA